MTAPVQSTSTQQTALNQLLSGKDPSSQTPLNQLLGQEQNQDTPLNRALHGAAADATGVSPFAALPDPLREQLEGPLGIAGGIGQAVKNAAFGIAAAGEGLIRLPEFAARNLAPEVQRMLGTPAHELAEGITEEERQKAKAGTALGLSLAVQPLATTGIALSLAGAKTATGLAPLAGPVTRGATRVGGSIAAGGVFGATRPRAEDEKLSEAIMIDAALFGGLHLAGALLFRQTRPLRLNADEILEQAKGEVVLGGSPALKNQLADAGAAVAGAELKYFDAARRSGISFSQATDILERVGGLPRQAGKAIKRGPEEIPKIVQRIEEPGVQTQVTGKPQGLFTTPADVVSPHLDLKGTRTFLEVNTQANILRVDASGLVTTNRGLVGKSGGIAALENLVGPKEFKRLLKLDKSELIGELSKKHPNVEWSRFFDAQEVLEGYAGVLARRKGFDAIFAPDRMASEFTEFIGLTKKAFTRKKVVAPPAKETLPPVNVEAFKELRQLRGELEAVKLAEISRRRLLQGARGEELATGLEYGKAVFEEIQEISTMLTAEGLAHTQPTLIGLTGEQIHRIASNPRNIGIFRRFLGSPSKWTNIPGPVGDAAGRVVWNAIDRVNIAVREADTWRRIMQVSRTELHKGHSKFGATARAREVQLGKMLNTVFDPEDIPVTMPANLKAAFTPIRQKLLSDRETLRMLTGSSIDFGIDAYLPHVFVGEWVIKDAATGKFLAIKPNSGVKQAMQELSAQIPERALQVEPRTWQLPAGFSKGHMTRAFGTKFFGHAQPRLADLPGFIENPYRALESYSMGYGRKVAFHDFKQKAATVTDALRSVKGAEYSAGVIDLYVQRVLGNPGPLEQATRSTLEAISGGVSKAANKLGFSGTIEQAVGLLPDKVIKGTQSLASKLTYYESLARLGYSPTAWLVNMSQTAVNTATAIGWQPTMKGIRLLADREQRPLVDALLRQFEIELNVPLSMADQITRKMIGDLSVWHPLYLFNRVEQANRAIAGLSKYQEQIGRGAGHLEAVQSAKKFIAETQFIYNIADTPMIMQGPVGSAAFQFKKFVIKELEFLWSIRNNPAAIARFTLNIQTIGGVSAIMSLPPASLIDWAAGKLTGERLSERAQGKFPRLSRGLPGMLGVDLGANVAPGVPSELSPEELLGPGPNDIVILARELISPAFLDLIDKRKGNLTPEEKGRAVAKLAPVVLRRLMAAYDVLEQESVRSPAIPDAFQSFLGGTQDVNFFPDDPRREAALTATGLRSAQRAEAFRVQGISRRESMRIKEADEAVVQRWATAFLRGNEREAQRILDNAEKRGLVITGVQLKGAIERAFLGRFPGVLRRAPKETKEQVLLRFNNFIPR